jgi:hypothetical protein
MRAARYAGYAALSAGIAGYAALRVAYYRGYRDGWCHRERHRQWQEVVKGLRGER